MSGVGNLPTRTYIRAALEEIEAERCRDGYDK
jgi:hypothetical protein